MQEEQKNTIAAFRKNIDKQKIDKFIIYGTGINAEAVVKNCTDYSVVGIMDVAKTGQSFCGLPILSMEEILEKGIQIIIVVARPAVHTIIYKRIREWCIEHQIEVYDIYGKSMEEKLKIQTCDSPYFDISYENLIKEIDSHEIISFDIFDTVLMRRVYEPTDVFLLLDCEVNEAVPFSFSKMRREAELELLEECEPNLYQIYKRMGEKYHLSQETCDGLMERELNKERQVLIVRKRMKKCIDYCRTQGKRFFFVSDMYLPSEILKDFLGKFGITGYEDILVSCEYQVSKSTGLFKILKKKARGESYLHIGDNEEADYHGAIRYGIDAFLIKSAMRMLEISSYKNALAYLNGPESRVMLGLLAGEVFNDPFILYHSKGKPVMEQAQSFGFAFIAPLITAYLVWLFGSLKKKGQGILLFSARDGWMIQKAYHILGDRWRLAGLPEDIYFMISRKAVIQAEEALDGQAGIAYRKYLDSLNLNFYRQIYLFDFMSRGTCQTKLEKIIRRKIKGLYFQKSFSGDKEKDSLDVEAYFKETLSYASDLRVFAMCDFLECIITSYQPSFLGMKEDGSFIYDEEKRSEEQIECLKEIHKGILDYCEYFAQIMGKFPKQMPPAEFCDEILKYTNIDFSVINIPALEDFMLDDWLGGDKNTGRDVLN
ncbi:hypothetical protein D5278_20305 [bacterium 1XD21-13]|nr:hypothetical protein [bacterium 1XD21-13]